MTSRGDARRDRALEGLVGLLILVVLLVAARDRVIGPDEAIWSYVARVWVEDGVPPYQGPVENKTPGIFYVFALSRVLGDPGHTVPRLFGVAASLGCSAALYGLGSRLVDRTTGLTAALVAGLALTSRAVGGREMAGTESFLACFTALAVLLMVSGGPRVGRSRGLWMLGAGAMFGAAIAFKQVALVTAPALAGFAWACTPPERRSARLLLADLALVAAGAGLATAASLAPLLLAGVSVAEYWSGAWLLLLDRGSSLYALEPRARRFWLRLGHPVSTLVLVVIAFALCWRRLPARGLVAGAVLLWVLVEGLGVASSGYSFPHHYKEIVPPLALAAGMMVSLAVQGAPRWRMAPSRLRAGILIAIVAALAPWAAVQNALAGQGPQRAYGQHVDAGEWVREHTQPGDHVYTFVYGGIVQVLSERRSSSRYFNRHFVTHQAAVDEVLRDLGRRPPRVVVVEGTPPPWLRPTLAAEYARVHQFERLAIHERRP